MKEIKVGNKGEVALVSDEDFEMLIQYKWGVVSYRKQKYAVRSKPICKNGAKGTTTEQMHRVIMNAKKGQIVDHKDHNGLNNQRENLRICTTSQNIANSRKNEGAKMSKYKGVSYYPKARRKWMALIMHQGTRHNLGMHHSAEDAARAYNFAAINLFGEYACLNKLPDETPCNRPCNQMSTADLYKYFPKKKRKILHHKRPRKNILP